MAHNFLNKARLMFGKYNMFKKYGAGDTLQAGCSYVEQMSLSWILNDWYSNVSTSIDDGQSTFLSKLIVYLDITNPKQNADIEKLKKVLSTGHCHGLSIIHGAMDQTGKLEWFEAALTAITNWDERAETLNTDILLPDCTDGKSVKFSSVFFRIINYLVSCHVTNYHSKFRLEDANCLNILSPDDNFFEILQNNKILKIQHVTKLPGYFSRENLRLLLNEDFIRDSICLIHNPEHVIRIGYKENGQWIIYNPNYPHGRANTPVHKIMNKEALITEIFKIQNHSLSIEIAHLTEPKALNIPLKEYNNMLEQNLPELLQGFGLSLITRETYAALFPKILDRVEKDEASQTVFTQVLGFDYGYYETALEEIAKYCPQYFDRTIQIALNTPNGEQSLRQSFKKFAKQRPHSGSTLSGIASFHPENFQKIFNYYLHYTDNNPELIGEILESKLERNNRISLLFFDRKAQNHLSSMLAILSKSENAHHYLIRALAMKCTFKDYKLITEEKEEIIHTVKKQEKKSGIDWLILWKSNNLDQIISMITADLNEEKISFLLDYPDVIIAIAQYQPNALTEMFQHIETSQICQKKLTAFLKSKILANEPADAWLALLKEPLASLLFGALAQGDFGFQNTLGLLTKQDLKGISVIQHLLEKNEKEISASLMGLKKLFDVQSNEFQRKHYMLELLLMSTGTLLASQTGSLLYPTIGTFLLLASFYPITKSHGSFNQMKNNGIEIENRLHGFSKNPNGLFSSKTKTPLDWNPGNIIMNIVNGLTGKNNQQTQECRLLLNVILEKFLETKDVSCGFETTLA